MRRLRDYSLCLCLLLLWPLAVNADDSWRQIQTEARGQTVWFNAWGGDPAVNRYLAWVSEEVKRYYAIDLRIVPVADAADAVKRIQTEAQAGRRQGGSVDLLWINGENFRTLKQANLLLTGWAESLPNWRYVDLQKPVREDFSVATEGAESPWGSAQLTFIARRGQTPQPPTSPQALLAFARAHPGSVTYPRPPDFTGTALLEQLLIALTDQPAALRQPPPAGRRPEGGDDGQGDQQRAADGQQRGDERGGQRLAQLRVGEQRPPVGRGARSAHQFPGGGEQRQIDRRHRPPGQQDQWVP